MKVCVYAISKNESANVDRFMRSVKAAGLQAYVLDHSTDNTAELLREYGAIVDTTPVTPWRWDDGKNAALALVPKDFEYCINLDMDEELSENCGNILSMINPDSTRVRHLFKPDGKIDRVREDFRLHRRHGYRWKDAVHEYIVAENDAHDNIQTIDDVLIIHWPSPDRKHTATAGLAVAVKNDPTNQRLRMLYGRDLYFDEQYKVSKAELYHFTKMPKPNKFDLSYAWTLIAKCHHRCGEPGKELAALEAAVFAFDRRESFVDLAHAYLLRGMYREALDTARGATRITAGQYSAHNDPGAWTFKPHEIAMIAQYNMGELSAAMESAQIAIDLATDKADRKRISENMIQIGAAA